MQILWSLLVSSAGTNLQKNIRRTLEILKLKLLDSAGDEIAKMQKYCRKLKNVNIMGSSFPIAGLADCLSSFRVQLEYATFASFEYGEFQQVVENFTNSRFNILFRNDNPVPYLGLFAKQLENVTFRDRLGDHAEPVDFILRSVCGSLNFRCTIGSQTTRQSLDIITLHGRDTNMLELAAIMFDFPKFSSASISQLHLEDLQITSNLRP